VEKLNKALYWIGYQYQQIFVGMSAKFHISVSLALNTGIAAMGGLVQLRV